VGGKEPRGVRVLLANPRWERRFVRFLELSGVGRAMADGTDEEAAHAARMDEWIVWETRRGVGGLNCLLACFSFFFPFVYCMGVLLPPSLAHSAPWRTTDPVCCS